MQGFGSGLAQVVSLDYKTPGHVTESSAPEIQVELDLSKALLNSTNP